MNPTQFKPGQSGNPGGRPKAVLDVQQLARKRSKENLAILVKWAEQESDPQVSLRATIALHEIAWGKPTQAVQSTGGEGGPIVFKWQDA